MQDALIMNRLPLPQYYDGNQWNTVLRPTRKCIPKYLHDDLPALKHMYIKEKFKQIGRFNCPRLDYFDAMIKHRKPTVKSVQKKVHSKGKKKEVSFQELKEELQYALIIADKESNIVDELLQKAKSCSKTARPDKKNTQKQRSMSMARDTGKYFGNTVDLVFRQRKKQCSDSQNAVEEPDTSRADEKINTIKLLKLDYL